MRHIIAATLLASTIGTTAALPAAAQTTQWSGSHLVVTPLAGCRVAVERAYLQGSGWSASIHLVFRNRGSAPASVTANVELAGNGQSKSGSYGPYRIVPAAASDQQTLSPYGGSLTDSTLRVRYTACTAG
jgi:hypothetical protein